MDRRPDERRIGHRKSVVGLQCKWDLDGAGVKKRLFKRYSPTTAEVVELSLSGATIVAVSSPLLTPGTAVALEIEGQRGGVAIRNIAPASIDGFSRYGVEFLQLEPGIRIRITEFVGSDRPDNLETIWHNAR